MDKKLKPLMEAFQPPARLISHSLWKEFFEPGVKVDHLVLCLFLGNDLVDNSTDLKLSTYGETDNSFFLDSEGIFWQLRKHPGPLKSTVNYLRDHSILMDSLYESAYRVKKGLQGEAGGGGGDEGGRIDKIGRLACFRSREP